MFNAGDSFLYEVGGRPRLTKITGVYGVGEEVFYTFSHNWADLLTEDEVLALYTPLKEIETTSDSAAIPHTGR